MSEGGNRDSTLGASIEKAPNKVDEDLEYKVLRTMADRFPETVSGGTRSNGGLHIVHLGRG
jgi:ABC-type uncharacterized transport system YnjBCD ATPase subunit